jgi:hypothetical protein
VYSGASGAVLWHIALGGTSGSFGSSVAGPGDLNADGHDDLVVGANALSSSGAAPGTAYVLYGPTGSTSISLATPTWARLAGQSVCALGDVTGDGTPEIAVGAPSSSNSGQSHAVFVWNARTNTFTTWLASSYVTGQAYLSRFGWALAATADVDGDGWPDLAVGTPRDSFDGGFSGSVFVISGTSGALVHRAVNTGDSYMAEFGQAVAAGEDVNGDGALDLLIGAPSDNDEFDPTGYVIPEGRVVAYSLVCPQPLAYSTAKVNSLGCTPAIGWLGTPTLSDPDDFELVATDVLSAKPSLMVFARAAAATPFHGGTMCVQPPFVRSPMLTASGGLPSDCSGTLAFPVSHQQMWIWGLGPGERGYAQFWYRDADAGGYGLTDALEWISCY